MGTQRRAGGATRIVFLGSLLSCCAPPATAPEPVAPAATAIGGTTAFDSRTCAGLQTYALASHWIVSHATLEPNAVVLVRPSEESTNIDESATILAHADSYGSGGSPKLKVLSELLHAELESLRRLLAALNQNDDGAYRTESARFREGRERLMAIGRERDAECRTSFFKISGRLPPVVIQKRVREHYDEFRHCYEAGLGRNPKLEGKVTVRFVIDRTGHVTAIKTVDATSASGLTPDPGTEEFFARLGIPTSPKAEEPATTLPDPEAVACVVDGYRSITFPPPEGGIVTVVYPIMFSPEKGSE